MMQFVKTRTTVTLSEGTLRAVKLRAARDGKRESEVIDEALRRALGLDVFEELWEKATLDEDAAMDLSREAQEWARESTE